MFFYKWLVRRTAASFMGPCRVAAHFHRFRISGTDYYLDAKHKISEEDGFLSFYHPAMLKANPELDGVRKSTEKNAEFLESLKQNCWEVAAVWKEPKLHYLREWELVELMEQNGIGTDGTLPTYIEKLMENGLVHLNEQTRELKPSPFGVALVMALEMMEKKLVDDETRAMDERNFQRVADGLASKDQVIQEVLGQKKNLLDDFIAQSSHTKELPEKQGTRKVLDCYDQKKLAPLSFLMHVVSTSKTIGASPLFPKMKKEDMGRLLTGPEPEKEVGLSVTLAKGYFQLERWSDKRIFYAYFRRDGDGRCPKCDCRELTLEGPCYFRTACLLCDGQHLGLLLESRIRLVRVPEKLDWNKQPESLKRRVNEV